MGKMPHLVKERKKAKRLGEADIIKREEFEGFEIDTRLEMIRALIPLGIMAIYEELDREVVKMAGVRDSRKSEGRRYYRHGTNPGSVKLAGQRVSVKVPRVRGLEGEVKLSSYDRFHRGGGGVSLTRHYFVGYCMGFPVVISVCPKKSF